MPKLRIPAIIAAVLWVPLAASADSKITTRSTVAGYTSEGSTYIKGARERTEMSLPMGMGKNVTIIQCDQKRIITINPQNNTCMVTPMPGEEAGMAAPANEEPAPPTTQESLPTRKGGTVTFTTATTDTGERQKMFGLTARHLKTKMTAISSPDACTPAGMSMERDGWYADIAPSFTCRARSSSASALTSMRRARPGCRDNFQIKHSGPAMTGYPLKETTTMNSGGQNFTMSTEVLDLSTATLDASLFDMPAGCKVVNNYQELMGMPQMGAMQPPGMHGAPPPATHEMAEVKPPAPAAKAAPAAPAAAPAASTVAPKTAGTVRVGVVKIKDATGQYLPTDNLRINLQSEITKRNMEAVPLSADSPNDAVIAEAQQKQCDYVLFTTAQQVSEPGGSGLTMPAPLPTVKLDSAKYQALLAMTLYKTGKPAPALKDAPVAADAEQFGVNAVMAGFEKEAEKVADQVKKDSQPQRAPASAGKKKPVAPKKP